MENRKKTRVIRTEQWKSRWAHCNIAILVENVRNWSLRRPFITKAIGNWTLIRIISEIKTASGRGSTCLHMNINQTSNRRESHPLATGGGRTSLVQYFYIITKLTRNGQFRWFKKKIIYYYLNSIVIFIEYKFKNDHSIELIEIL